MPKLTLSVVKAAAPREKQYTIWCSELAGFGVYILPTGKRTYFVDYRNADGVRHRITIGRHGKITTEEARKLAIGALGRTVHGEDPAQDRTARRKAITVDQLCDDYLAAAEKGLILGKKERPKKPSTLATDRGRIERHIRPLLGRKLVKDVVPADIVRFISDVSLGKTAVVEKTNKLRGKAVVEGGRGTATRTVGLLGGIMSYAVENGVISHNPVTGVKRPAYKERDRRLSPEEFQKLGAALRAAKKEGEIWQAVLGVQLLALTGARFEDIETLKWAEVDEGENCFRLDDSKEGASVRPIGEPVFSLLGTIDRSKDAIFVLPAARKKDGHYGGLDGAVERIMQRAGFSDVTAHTLRHSYASVAGDLGYAEATIAAMVGHAKGSVTSKYIHHLDSVLVAAADNVAKTIAGYMSGELATEKSLRRRHGRAHEAHQPKSS
ncbi:integrase [Rhodoblastus acidophilus]|uniref:tyrosine-type recombinase/integrase n=1 Tax=Rhodoblastus acidophilus TaxID=1074 RepID=UPI0022241386|nr:site-specific integrase [Rhodoblastus acidophilus]MCW2283786.1 integrase [Rhodoblastus acidophilus]MCW2332865.1 integrase [Rhodoblastus acidophilus]